MPIDDALGKIEDKKENSAEKRTISSEDRSYELFVEAQKILGSFLIKLFPRQSSNINSILKTLGPFVIDIAPGESKIYSPSLRESIDALTWSYYLKTIAGGYLETTDMKDYGQESSFKLEDLPIPELFGIKRNLDEIAKSSSEELISPYIFVMGMRPIFRPLVAVSINKTNKNRELCKLVYGEEGLLLSLVPRLESIAETAKEYGIKEVKYLIKDLSRVVKAYSK
ncbi:hypothetical protein HYT56_04240 [Candidatus Woesearchaeota archaeon]|nr:hypothetical protein [Candidatus Woesearchaeota archaeon]